jgi:hypothetical protein
MPTQPPRSTALTVRTAAVAYSERVYDTGEPMLKQAFIDAARHFQAYLSTLSGGLLTRLGRIRNTYSGNPSGFSCVKKSLKHSVSHQLRRKPGLFPTRLRMIITLTAMEPTSWKRSHVAFSLRMDS